MTRSAVWRTYTIVMVLCFALIAFADYFFHFVDAGIARGNYIPWAFMYFIFPALALGVGSFVVGRITKHFPEPEPKPMATTQWVILYCFSWITIAAGLIFCLYENQLDIWLFMLPAAALLGYIIYKLHHEKVSPIDQGAQKSSIPRVQASGMTDVAETIAKELGRK